MKAIKRISGMTAASVALLAMSGTASALTYQGAEFTASAAGYGTTWDLTLTMDFTNADENNEFLGDMLESWSLTLPGSATLGVVSDPDLVGFFVGTTAQASANGCGGGQVNAICADYGAANVLNGGGPEINMGDVFSFTVSLIFDQAVADLNAWTGNFHLLSVVEARCPGGPNAAVGPCYKKDGGLISQPLNVPEPSTLALLGLGLVGLGLGSRRRKA